MLFFKKKLQGTDHQAWAEPTRRPPKSIFFKKKQGCVNGRAYGILVAYRTIATGIAGSKAPLITGLWRLPV